MLSRDNQKGTQCVHVSTEVLEKLTRCDLCGYIYTHCQWEQVFLSAVVAVQLHKQVARPYAQIRKWRPKHRTFSHIRFNFVTSENIRL